MKLMKASLLVEDFDIYPRLHVDSTHVNRMCDSLDAGRILPPVVIDKKSKRIIDGLHRRRAHIKKYGLDAEIEVIERTFKNDGEMLMEAARLNADHGRPFDTGSRVRVLTLARKFKIKLEDVSQAIGITCEKANQLVQGRTAVGGTLGTIPIKATIRHMAGQPLTVPQQEANDRLGGNQQMFYVNQLILLMENDLLDRENAGLIARLRRLNELIDAAIAERVG